MRIPSLPIYKFWMLLCCILAGQYSATAQIAINGTYNQSFDTLATSGTADVSTLPAGWSFVETGTGANTTYVAGTGSSNTGNMYSFGTDTDRALGALLSGSVASTIGASFVNNTGNTVSELKITYTGEQWRSGTVGRLDRLDFQYSLNAASLTSGDWTDVDALDFSSPSTTTAGALNGNLAANRSTITFTISGLSIANGATFFFRWLDFNASGADDGLALDDFTISLAGGASLALQPTSLNFGNVNVNESKWLSYTVAGSNLTQDITITTASPFSLSSDSSTFANTVTLPPTGGKVYVRFSPTATGVVNELVTHVSGNVQKSLIVSGNGFDQVSSIIPIAEARAKAVGEIVTVAGRITVANQFGGPSYLQDATGGIPVFYTPLSRSVAIGDSVIVTGPVSLFNDQKQISGTGTFFTKVTAAQRTVVPAAITLNQLAAYEGQLVTVQDVEFVNKNFILLPDNTQRISSDSIQADLRIDGDTDLPSFLKPQTAVNITGVVGRFRANAQLLPRFQSDIPGLTEQGAENDSLPKDQTFDVVTWNVEWFNSPTEGPSNDTLQFANVKKVIEQVDADVYAFEEIANDSAFALLDAQLPGYKAFTSPIYSYYFDPQGIGKEYQKIAFLYKTSTVDSVSTKVLLKDLYEGVRAGNTALLPNYPGEPTSFWASGRLPFLFEFTATIQGESKRIHLVDIHARANSGTDITRYNRRKYDVELLKDTLDAHYPAANLIIVGDYNDDVDVSVINNLPSSFEEYVKDTLNYQALTLPISQQGYYSYLPIASFLDHITISNELFTNYVPNSVGVVTPFNYISNYTNTTSDHIPVTARFQFKPVVDVCFPSVQVLATPSNTVCAGTNVTFAASTTNGGNAPTYQWTLNGVVIPGAIDSVYASATLASGDKIGVRLTSNAACLSPSDSMATDSIQVIVNPLPQVSIVNLPKVFCQSDAPVTLVGTPAGGSFTVDGVSSTQFNPASAKANSLVVYAYTDSLTGCRNSVTQQVVVKPAPVANAGEDKKVYVGYFLQQATLLKGSATGGNGGPYRYLWSNGARTASIIVYPSKTTVYTLTITDAAGCKHIDSVTVAVEDVRCGWFGWKVSVCYKGKSYCVNQLAAALLLQNGATLGNCATNSAAARVAIADTDAEKIELGLDINLTASPNPFVHTTSLAFTVPVDGYATLRIYDSKGSLVQSVFEGKAEAAQSYQFELDGSKLANGIYIARLTTSAGVKIVKLSVSK